MHHYCWFCFAEQNSSKRDAFGWFLLSIFAVTYVMIGNAASIVLIGVPLAIGYPRFFDFSALVRAAVVFVPGTALGLYIWRHRPVQ